MKKTQSQPLAFIVTLLVSLVVLFGFLPATAATEPYPIDLNLKSSSLYLIDAQTGRPLYAKKADTRRAVASITKIMTALLVLERTTPDEEVVVSAKAAHTGGSTIGLKAGDVRRVGDLTKALLIASANDAAVALAEHVGGSEFEFVRLMNMRARKLGAANTRFVNPHGLPGIAKDGNYYSTAVDLSKIALEAMKHDEFRRLVSTRRMTWETTTTGRSLQLTNSNHLLERYPLATGIKTGYTNESGYCLAAGGARGDRSAIAIVLGAPSREDSFNDAETLLDLALERYEYRPIVLKDHRYGVAVRAGRSIPLVATGALKALVYNGSDGPLVLKTRLRHGLKLPIRKGDKLGSLIVSQMGQELGLVELAAGRSVSSPHVMKNMADYFWRVVKEITNLL